MTYASVILDKYHIKDMEGGFIRIREDKVEIISYKNENNMISLYAVNRDRNRTLIVKDSYFVEWTMIYIPPPDSYTLPMFQNETYNLQFGTPPGFEELAEFLRNNLQDDTK